MMAKLETKDPLGAPLLGLTQEMREHLESMGPEFDKAIEYMDAMEKIGVDSSRLRAQVEQSIKMRDVMLKVLK